MTEAAANLLMSRLERDQRWPAPFERKAIGTIGRHAAFRESDRPALKVIHGWPDDRVYAVDPLATRISEAYADLLFSEDPTITAAAEGDQGNVDRIIETSDLPSELHWAEQINSSEGEVWWRTMSTPGVTPSPQITFHSRENAVPLFVGAHLVAVAFVSEFDDPAAPQRSERPPVLRHLEVQTEGRIENRLYRGDAARLGDRVDLETFSETAELFEEWEHQLPGIAAGRILNKRGRERRAGKSDYDGIEDILLALNEAMTIGVENVRLVAKKRAIVPAEAVDGRAVDELADSGDGQLLPTGQRAQWDAGADLLTVGTLDSELGNEGAGPFKVLEYSFDAEQLVAWQNKLAKVAASRAGLTAQLVGEGDGSEGEASSGTALRVRLLPAIGSGKGRGRPWDDALPRALMFAQLFDTLSPAAGGYGRSYSKAGDAPAVERKDPLPRDEAEEVARHAAAVQGEIESIETAVRDRHPDWDEARIAKELKDIRSDSQDRARSMGLGVPPAPEPPQ